MIAAIRPAFEKYKNIGVRIEDDVLITSDGYRNMSAALPRTVPEIEAFMARAARELTAGRSKPQQHGSASVWPGRHIEDNRRWLQPDLQAHEPVLWRLSYFEISSKLRVVEHVSVGDAGKFFRRRHTH